MSMVAEDELTIGRASTAHHLQGFFINLAMKGGVLVGWINNLTCA
jgi:hypothetical protein